MSSFSKYSIHSLHRLRAQLLIRIERLSHAGATVLPTVDELSFELQEPRAAIVKVIRGLLRERYLIRDGQKRILIADPWGDDVRVRLHSAREVVTRAGVGFTIDVVQHGLGRVPMDEAVALGFDTDQRLGRSRLIYRADGRPLVLVDWCFDMARFPGVANLDQTGWDLLSYFRKIMPTRHFATRIRAIAADEATATRLEVPVGHPCLELIYLLGDDVRQLVRGSLKHNGELYELPGALLGTTYAPVTA